MLKTYKESVKKAQAICYSANVVRKGLKVFRETGNTPSDAYGQMIALYCKTRGLSREVLGWWIKRGKPKPSVQSASGALGYMSSADIRRVAGEIKQKGYYVFPSRLDAEACARLTEFALTQPSRPSPACEGLPDTCIYNPNQPAAVTYRFTEHQLANNDDIQRLICDPTFLGVAQAYLGTSPVFDLAAMWWTTAFQKEADDHSAQLYHFDMDHNRWIKIFIYLSDVTPDTGPHCYIEGTHKALSKPGTLLNRGYVRIPDSDLRKYYSEDRFKEISGPAGTIIAGDTSAFHKGKPIVKGHRLLLEFEYGDSLFGANLGKIGIDRPTEDLLRAMKERPACFARLALNNPG